VKKAVEEARRAEEVKTPTESHNLNAKPSASNDAMIAVMRMYC